LEPRSPDPHFWLGQAYEATQQYEKAISEYGASEVVYAQDPAAVRANYETQLASLKENGPRGWWQTKLSQMRQSPSPDSYEMAKVCVRLGDNAAAFALLEKSYREHNGVMLFLLYDDCWD